ncbi:DUF4233 domain-containing protein [Cellulomonas carbonis]|uniref:DUF4233 domain-containing protein n=1 Tax=Cellulomonas carbonis T26 TaxID=947969 RepID=A0A0A0BW97_9CELL|nr:DUF4233 domain-containing protein [Cellulomonas carbonis]KGM11972.1 hypothetical protein N868_03335 [Cellulomonas carbonis T26]GGB98055.1 hypothetical protein GCM10010972_08570 [Cellulomonas carbonis]
MSASTSDQPPTGRDTGSEGGTGRAAGSARPPRSARRQFAATILSLEAFVVLFATLAAYGLRLAPAGTVWLLGGSLALSMLLVAGMLRWPAGYWAGSVLQLPLLVLGLAVREMLLVGGIFVVLWVVALRLGGRIDAERAERAAAAPLG